jgi:hypothetical protein
MVLVERSIAWVKPGNGGKAAGLAFALDERHVVTCAHVVNGASKHELRTRSRPDDPQLLLEFVLGEEPGRLLVRNARVVVWGPDDGQPFDCSDIAVLEVDEVLPPTVVIPRLGFGPPLGTVCAFGPGPDGDHEGHVRGELMGVVRNGRLQLDQHPGNARQIGPGASGVPVWRRGTGVVVGMLQARGTGEGRGADLQKISARTGGQAFAATDPSSLADAFVAAFEGA